MAHYFGYGSNMSRSFIENVRGISPKKSVLGCLENYSLIMNLKGPNFVEPSFANIRYEKGKIVEGILHEISDLELEKIIASEGIEYQIIEVPVRVENGTHMAKTLIWSTDSNVELPTSRRYLNLLLKAAHENKLSAKYIAEIKKKKSVYYPILSEYFSIYAYFWVKTRAKKIKDKGTATTK